MQSTVKMAASRNMPTCTSSLDADAADGDAADNCDDDASMSAVIPPSSCITG